MAQMQTRNRPTIKLRGGPHGIPRPVVAEVQRQRLCDAIVEVVADNGYRATTVDKVLKRARISRRTFYELFADLDECYLVAYQQATEDVLGAVAAACAEGDSPERRVEGGLRALLEYCAQEPQLARACLVEVLAASEAARARRRETIDEVADLLAGALGDRWGGGPPARLRARVLIGGVHELIYDRVARGDHERLPDLADEILASFFPTSPPVPHGA